MKGAWQRGCLHPLTQPVTATEWAVCILLECILVTDHKGNVFTGVCHSVHNRPHGYSFTAHLYYCTVGTHPIGMLSCLSMKSCGHISLISRSLNIRSCTMITRILHWGRSVTCYMLLCVTGLHSHLVRVCTTLRVCAHRAASVSGSSSVSGMVPLECIVPLQNQS